MRMNILAMANQKGGVGKTTSTVNLAASLAEMSIPTLVIDLDPQGNLSSAFGMTPTVDQSLYRVLTGERTLAEQIVPTPYPNLDILPADLNLAGCEIEIARLESPLVHLRKILEEYRPHSRHAITLLDCPPSLGILMSNALAAADAVIVPLQCEFFALEGLSKIVQVMEQIRSATGRESLPLAGILLTMYDARTNLSRQVVDDVRQHFGDKVFNTIIPRSIRLGEAPSHGKPITDYDATGLAAQSYRQFAKEIVGRFQLT